MGSAVGRRLRALTLVVGMSTWLGVGPTLPDGVVVRRTVPVAALPDLAGLGWKPVLNETFDGSTLNPQLWRLPGDNPTDDDLHSPDTVSVGGGNLVMRTYTDAAGIDHTSSVLSGEQGNFHPNWRGFDATYGYVEARIQLPDGPRTKTSFWLMSANGNTGSPLGDPGGSGPEIDIVEHENRPATDSELSDGDDDGDLDGNGRCDWPSTSTLPCRELYLAGGHWDGFDEEHTPMHHEPVANPTPASSLQGRFHTYGVLWTPDEYRFYVDGIEVKRVTEGLTYAPEHLLLVTYVRPSPTVSYGALGSSANDVTLVDYVRWWQRPVSDVPDQSTAVSTPTTVPFTVQDYFYGSPTKGEPGSVRVTATSSNQALVPNSGLAVTGNGPAKPGGEFTNGTFELDLWGWATTGAAAASGEARTGAGSLGLTPAGGRAEQTVVGLEPSTTYLVGAHVESDLDFDDINRNGRVDPDEPFTEPNDTIAEVDWGIQDVDAQTAGDQQAVTHHVRDGTAEALMPAVFRHETWPHDMVKFTTGPDTTSVRLFFDNRAYTGTPSDSEVTVDDVYIRPIVSPQRTLAIRPADGKAGTTTVTLTAKNAAGSTLGTDTFVLTVGAGSLADGSFEADPTTTPWRLLNGGEALTNVDPFRVDHQLQLGTGSTTGTARQTVTGLAANARYRLDVTGYVSAGGGNLGIAVQNHGGAQQATDLTSTGSETRSIEFVTAGGRTSADVLLLDWDPADGTSFVQRVRLSRCATTTSCSSLATDLGAPPAPPALAGAGTRPAVSGEALAIPVTLPAGATLEGVSSGNRDLVPEANLAALSSPTNARHVVIAATPVLGRTGPVDLWVKHSGAADPVPIPVVVSDRHLLQPGFEKGAAGWALAGSASAITSGQRSGAYALELGSGGSAVQKMTGVPHDSRYSLGGWVQGNATVTVRSLPVYGSDQPAVLAVANWTGSGWTEHTLDFDTPQCTECTPAKWHPIEVTITPVGGGTVRLDDLRLLQGPALRRIRDMSLHSDEDWWTNWSKRWVKFGRVPASTVWNPWLLAVSTSDVPGFGHGVLTPGDLGMPAGEYEDWPYSFLMNVSSGSRTGRASVDLTLTDPATGATTSESFAVTVNAGDNFNNGDFQRGLGDWSRLWFSDRQVVAHRGGRATNGDSALLLTTGMSSHKVTGLAPNTSYVVRANAWGSGSSLRAYRTGANPDDPYDLGDVLGEVDVDSTAGWAGQELWFTTGPSETAVWIVLWDETGDTPAPTPNLTTCAQLTKPELAGATCFDDVGVFLFADIYG